MDEYEIHLFNLDDPTGEGRKEFMKLKNKAINQPEAKGKVNLTTHFYMKNRSSETVRMDESTRDVDKSSWQEQWVRCEVLKRPPARMPKSTNINKI